MKNITKNYLFGGLAILVVLFGAIALSSSNTQAESVGDAELDISDTSWDFGNIQMSEGIATKSITLTNNTSSEITLTKLETSCMCTTAQIVREDGSKSGLKGMLGMSSGSPYLSESVKAGETATLLVNFDPNAHGPNGTGPITRNVYLETNSQSQSEIKFTFSGNVIK